jgi:hypothetical protein
MSLTRPSPWTQVRTLLTADPIPDSFFLAPCRLAASHQSAGSIPRKINTLRDRLMLLGCLDKKHAFTAAEVSVVTGEMQQELVPEAWRAP